MPRGLSWKRSNSLQIIHLSFCTVIDAWLGSCSDYWTMHYWKRGVGNTIIAVLFLFSQMSQWRNLEVPSGLAWKRSSSLQIIPLFLFTVMWLFVMPLTPNSLKDVHQAEEEDARRVLTWLMSTLWLRAQFRWCSKKERKNSQVAWIWGVCIHIKDQ